MIETIREVQRKLKNVGNWYIRKIQSKTLFLFGPSAFKNKLQSNNAHGDFQKYEPRIKAKIRIKKFYPDGS